MANPSIFAAFERMWQHVVSALGHKAEIDHDHNDTYYTEAEIDEQLSSVNAAIDNMANGTTPVQSATKATQDANGNIITDTYETKSDAQSKFDEAKAYTDEIVNALDEDYYTKTEIDAQVDEINTTLAQKAQVQIVTWEDDD